jgi:hypothetical protein
MSTNVDAFMLAVTILRSIVRDMLIIKAGSLNAGLLNPDRLLEIEKASSGFGAESLSDYAERLEQMERLAGRNINREMLANALLTFWVKA